MFKDFETAKNIVEEHYKKTIAEKNQPVENNNGVFTRYKNPLLTREHTPPFWRYDYNEQTNPFFMERMGINGVLNTGAIYFNNKFMLMVRIEGHDRKSFFAIAESDNGIDNFVFRDTPVIIPTVENETNIYDMRLTQHEDGAIYGFFCSESKDLTSEDISSAYAQGGIVRTYDMVNFERLPNVKSKSLQQRNVVLHPEFVDGKYFLYTRPLDGFMTAGTAGGICTGFCDDINNPVVYDEKVLNERIYHTITEGKNGPGAVPIKTDKGYIHISHGVRDTADGMRYVLYVYATDLTDVRKVIARPNGYFIAPYGWERVGDVSNVVFCNGAIVKDGMVYIYYAGSDTRLYVATTTLERLIDYTFNTPQDRLTTFENNAMRIEMIEKNLQLMNK